MPALPYAVRSPVLRDLMRRLLLSSATMPEPEPDAPAADGSDLLSLRVSLLQSMGAFKDAVKLTSIIPTRDEDPMLLRLQAQDRLFANDFGSACQIVGGTGDHLQQPYWQQLLVFCQTLSGDTEGAALGASLLIERMGNDDAAFFELIDRLTQATDQPFTSLAKPSALHLAAMRTAQITIPDDAATTLNPAILRTIGVSPNARLETRLAAAESAVSYGALTMDRLSEIYMAEKYDPAELYNALSLAAADRSPRGRALLFQAAQIESVDLAKAAVISKGFEIGAYEGRYLHVIHLYRTLLADLSAATELNWFAAEASRALYALNRPLRARTWVEVLRRSATRNEESRSLLDSLWFLAFLTDSETASSDIEAGLASWLDHHAKRGTPEDSLRAAAGLRLLEALGHEVPDAAWWQLLQNPLPRAERSVNPIAHTALERAAAAGRRGETVMLVLLAFDGAGPRIDDLETAAVAVRALRQVGLEDEAKALALEFAVTGGL